MFQLVFHCQKLKNLCCWSWLLLRLLLLLILSRFLFLFRFRCRFNLSGSLLTLYFLIRCSTFRKRFELLLIKFNFIQTAESGPRHKQFKKQTKSIPNLIIFEHNSTILLTVQLHEQLLWIFSTYLHVRILLVDVDREQKFILWLTSSQQNKR